MPSPLMQLRRLTRSRLGVPMSDDFFTDSVIDDQINLAIQSIDAEYRWPWAEHLDAITVTSTDPDIVLDKTWRATRAVFCGEDELRNIAPADMLSWSLTTGTEPQVWCPMGSNLTVRPIVNTDTTLTHLWYAMPAWLSQDNDVADIPDQFTGSIVAKAAELLSLREGDGAAAGRHESEYQAWIARMRRHVRRATPPARTRVRPGGWI